MKKLTIDSSVIVASLLDNEPRHEEAFRIWDLFVEDMEESGRGTAEGPGRGSEVIGGECPESILPAGSEENRIFWGGGCAVPGGNHFAGQSVCQFLGSG